MPMEATDLRARIIAALRALAVGEAMGRATEDYRPAEIGEVYDDAVTELVEPVRLFDDEEWAAGETGTLTATVLRAAAPDPGTVAGSAQLELAVRLGRAVALGLSRPLEVPAGGTDGDAVVASIATAVAAAVAGCAAREVIGHAAQSAHAAGDGELAERIAACAGLAQASGGRRVGEALAPAFSPAGDARSLVPFILGIVYATQGARRAILEAVNQGGHAPESAAAAGALAAAIAPGSLPDAWGSEVQRRNGLAIEQAAARHLAARRAHPAQ